MGFVREFARSAFTFSLVTVGIIAAHFAGFDFWVPAIYHFSTFIAGTSYIALDPISVTNMVAFMFLTSLLFFGYLAPLAAAYVASQLLTAVIQGQLAPTEYLVLIPCGAALAAGLFLSSGLSSDFNHRGIVYSELKRGLALFGLTVILTALFIIFRLQILPL